MKFTSITLGQTVMKYQVPYDIFLTLNHIYERQFSNLMSANKSLIGKIENEHSIYFNGKNENANHNFLPLDILAWFNSVYRHYLDYAGIEDYSLNTHSIWINEMKQNEYNPMHIHNGDSFTGLSSVMILKLPDTFGKEYSAAESPQNGVLQMLGSASGQFSKTDYQPPMDIGDFYVFPYDMRHCVYPFNGTNQTRRTLAANCDVQYNEIKYRGVS